MKMNYNEGIVFFGILFICIALWAYYENSSVYKVYVCESNNITTYVSLHKPSKLMKFGICELHSMKGNEYYRMRNDMRYSNK